MVEGLPHMHAALDSVPRTTKIYIRNPNLQLLFYFMCVSIRWHACLCTAYVPDTHGGQKRVSSLLELE